jgi:hypothetical protein
MGGRRRLAFSIPAGNKKPARERITNDHLSPGRSKSDRLAGWSRKSQTIRPVWNFCVEKGRAGGRARQPARPLAWSRSKHLETTIASGVATYKLIAVRLLSNHVFVVLVITAEHEYGQSQIECQNGLDQATKRVSTYGFRPMIITSTRCDWGLRQAIKPATKTNGTRRLRSPLSRRVDFMCTPA